ncbi:MAG: hypothetical protein JST30_13845 [Armatimonadetes bacterium]|nr:hypothetical protein [Armatimonadota bacterium]
MDTIEQRLAALESTNRKYRAGLTACLVVLAFIAIAAPRQNPQQQQYPRQIVADTITVQSLNAYSGHVSQFVSDRATIGYADVRDTDAGTLTARSVETKGMRAFEAVLGRTTATMIDVRANETEGGVRLTPGSVSVLGRQDQVAASLGLEGESGSVSVFGKGGWTGFQATADSQNGTAMVYNGRGFVLASMGSTEKGDGRVIAHTRNGNKVAMLESDDTGQFGRVTVRKQGGEPMARLEAKDKSGRLSILDGVDETARFPND